MYETNFKGVERVLLGKVNVQLTVRLILRKAFAGIDNALTTQLLRLQDSCPTLFKRILSKSDQQALSLQLDDTSELEDVMDVEGVPDEGHVNPAVIARIASKDIQKMPHSVNDGRHLPVIPRTQCSQIFINLLRQAYGFDYNLSNMYTLTRGGLPMQWSKKFAFTDRYVEFSHVSSIFLRALAVILPLINHPPSRDRSFHRRNFAVGDYVRFHGNKVGRIDGIFTHIYNQERRAFIVLTSAILSDIRHALLDLPFVEDGPAIIVGLPAIEPESLYVINDKEGKKVWVNWQVEFL